MKVLLVISALLAVAVARPKVLAPLLAKDSPTAIDGEYIVVFTEEFGDDEVASHKELVSSMMLNGTEGSKITSHYQINGKGFRGYAATMDERLMNSVRAMEGVKYVERDQIAEALQNPCEAQSGATWGLVRTTLREWDSNPNDPPNEYEHEKEVEGAGVEVYIIDTGIDDTHPLFDGRADRGVDFVDNPPPSNGDPNGHGTHVAGTVMSNVYGLARSATSIGVRVLNAAGSGTFEGVIAGIDYVAQQAGQGKKIVGNMSLGGGLSSALNDATNACVQAGVHMAVAAGNENSNACTRSPASAERAVTAAASDTTDSKASFSNYGNCVDLIAPGVNVISTTPNGGTASFSGTSMSSPHIAGVIAKILSRTNELDDPDKMKEYLKKVATKDKITGFPTTIPTDNDLLFYSCGMEIDPEN